MILMSPHFLGINLPVVISRPLSREIQKHMGGFMFATTNP